MATQDTSDLLYEVRNGAAWLTLNREARRNALSFEAIRLFDEHLDRAENDPVVGVVCITGAGEKAFCSGADLMSLSSAQGGAAGVMKAYADLMLRLSRYPKPLVARVAGHCMAGGMGLLLSCDIAYAREGVSFGTPEVKVGLFPFMIAALILRKASRPRALEMIYTGRKLSAAEAADMGLVTRVYPDDELDAAVDGALGEIAANAPVALRMGRKALADIEHMPLDEALEHLCGELARLSQTEDAAEGMPAFLQKRKPVWKGR